MKTLIFGNGYIGNEYLNSKLFKESFLSEKDITRPDQIESEIEKYKPDVIINCAGWTNLEWCRDNKPEAISSNIAGPLNLLRAAKKAGIYFVHLATGCIFDGDEKGKLVFSEKDKPNPQCFYAYTKVIADELLLKEKYDKILILRLRLPISDRPNPRNLISKIISFDKLSTSQNSMTYLPDLISATKFLLDKKSNGIFNVCNSGTISPYQIAELAKSALGLKKNFIRATKKELDKQDKKNGREKRVDAIINIKKITKLGFAMPNIKTRVEKTLMEYKKTLRAI